MTDLELSAIFAAGENRTIEFKKSTTSITKDVYETVCSFSNRDGGHIFLGVKDDGTVLGVDPSCADKIKKDFVTSINNPQKIFPPVYLQTEDIIYEEKLIIHIFVPIGTQVYRCSGRIYDRNHDSDVDITDVADLVYKLYARKQNSYFVNKVFPIFSVSDLRHDLIERAREMTKIRTQNHAWRSMNDEELLRSANLILRDNETGSEGITLASILLFGPDDLICSVLAHHKTDAIFRVFNTDRYDDRDVIITNLLDSYDRLIAFGQKHLNDSFALDGIVSVSARDTILREIVSNLLAHRDFSSPYVAKLVIERDRILTENSNRTHGFGNLDISSFEPVPKNPAISKVFREIGLADELGSGMRNTYKYTRLYSGTEPQFIEGDIFKTIIPLNVSATAKVGPNLGDGPQVTPQVTPQDNPSRYSRADKVAFLAERIPTLCETPKTKKELAEFFGFKDLKNFTERYLNPLIAEGKIAPTIPDKPNSRNQKYVRK